GDTAWERTAWQAVQRAAWEALRKAETSSLGTVRSAPARSLPGFDACRELDSRSVSKDDDGERRAGGELPPHRDDALSAPRFADLDAADRKDDVATDEERLAVDGGLQGPGAQACSVRW